MAITNESNAVLNQIKDNFAGIVADTDYNFTVVTSTREWRNFRDWKPSELPSVIVQTVGQERLIYRGKRILRFMPVSVYATIEKRNNNLLEEDIEKFTADLVKKSESDPRLSGIISNGIVDTKIFGITRAIGEVDSNVRESAFKPRGLIIINLEVEYTGELNTNR